MKGLLFTVPVALVMAFAGLLLAYRAMQPPIQDVGIDFSQPRHLVTQEMEIETAAMANRRAPDVAGVTERGQKFEFAPEHGRRPQFVLFIKDGCPCSIDAQPLFNHLAVRYSGKVDFVGVIDGTEPKARNFATQFSVAFPVVADPNVDIIHKFEAKASVYSALVARNGHIVKMWPGYSADMLKDMNHVLAGAAGVHETPFDPQYAPIKKATGCAFAGTWR